MKDIENIRIIYDKAFKTYGDSTKSCLWDSPQIMRYSQLAKVADLNNTSILDIGCGLGGFFDYLSNDCKFDNIEYTGIDIIEGMLDTARQKYPGAIFKNINILEENLQSTYDYTFLCGVFNCNTENSDQYMKNILKKAFEYSNKGMAFNFISTYVNFRDEEMAYHSPEEVFHYCVNNLSTKIQMNHHYGKCDVSVFIYK